MSADINIILFKSTAKPIRCPQCGCSDKLVWRDFEYNYIGSGHEWYRCDCCGFNGALYHPGDFAMFGDGDDTPSWVSEDTEMFLRKASGDDTQPRLPGMEAQS